MLFTGFLINKNLQSSMVRTYVSAIRSVLAKDNIKLNDDTFLLKSLIRACKFQNDQVIARFPIYKGILHMLLKEAQRHFDGKQQFNLKHLYRAMFVSAYYGLLRAGEIAAGPHCILARNVHVGTNKHKILFLLKSSKTHTKGSKPQLIKISSHPVGDTDKQTTTQTCPFNILREHIAVRPAAKHRNEQFFVFSDGTGVSIEQTRHVLRLLLKQLNFDASLYNLHSFRIRRCGNLYELGLSMETIKKIGHWKLSSHIS